MFNSLSCRITGRAAPSRGLPRRAVPTASGRRARRGRTAQSRFERKKCSAAYTLAGYCRRATDVRVENVACLGASKDQRRPSRCRQGRRGFPPDSEMSCRCRPDRGENALATAFLFAQRHELAKQFIAKFWQGLVGWPSSFCFFSDKSFYYSFPSGNSRLVDNDDKIENLCH